MSWEEQETLFGELPEHLENMALLAGNTGCREAEICALQWDWKVSTPGVAGGSVRITTHYSAAELSNLFQAVSRVCKKTSGSYPALTILKRNKALHSISLRIDKNKSRTASEW